ncbi:MAG TPA: efflux RND transporter permease subunit, partial [Candidatus Saccharimonadales bacterium]|nr:efflux RND transporter permease subunit [Candidatus Saccharimonadales bacterium]
MEKQTFTPKTDGKTQARWLPRLSLFIFDRSRTAALLWLVITIFGVFSYTSLLKREGFPSINIPFSIVNGAYLVNDAGKVDTEVAKPISETLVKDERVKSVDSTALGNFYNVIVQYKEGVDAQAVGHELQSRIQESKVLPAQASVEFTSPKFGFTERGDDAVVSMYSSDPDTTTQELVAEGEKLAASIKSTHVTGLIDVSVINPYVTGIDPATGKQATSLTRFDRYGVREGNVNTFYDSVTVGASQQSGNDAIEFDTQLRAQVDKYNAEHANSPVKAAISASYAPQIKEQVNELQRALLEGLIAVLVVGSIIIAIRASIITVLAMVTVLAITLGVLLVIGYSLNTITLFSLILCLALVVDDTIIMIEAIDAQRRRRKDPRETIHVATGKISRAMVAATLTAAFSFVPLLFVGGILGSFIRAIPITVISSLLISLLVALVFIPVFARYLLLRKNQMGAKNVHEPAAGIEAKIARLISRPMLWARGSTKKLLGVGLCAVLVGFMFIGSAGYLFQKVTFNIFPPSKDANDLLVQLDFPPGSTTEEALAVARQSDAIVAKTLGEHFEHASYYVTGTALNASLFVHLTPYSERDLRSPQMVTQLEEAYKDFTGATVKASQLDVGPPVEPFAVRVKTNGNREAG